MVDIDHPDRIRSVLDEVPRSVLLELFPFWAHYGYTLRSILFCQTRDFDPSSPLSPGAFGWHKSKGTDWWWQFMPSFIPEGRGSKEHKAMRKRRDEAIRSDRERGYDGVNGQMFW